jgi:hypothetical protein
MARSATFAVTPMALARMEVHYKRDPSVLSIRWRSLHCVVSVENRQYLLLMFRRCARVAVILILHQNEIFPKELIISVLSLIRHGPHRKLRAHWFFYYCMCIRCYCNIFTEPLSISGRGYTYGHTEWWDVFMKDSIEMRSGAMIYVPRSRRLVQAFKFYGGRDSDTDSMGFTEAYFYFTEWSRLTSFVVCTI